MLVRVLIYACITSCVVSRKVPFTLEETYQDRLNHSNSRWSAGKSGSSVLEYLDSRTGDVVAYDTSKNETFILLTSKALFGYDKTWYRFSSDRRYALLRRNTDSVHPWSETHKYSVFSREEKRHKPMGDLQHAEWIPGKLEILYVKSNNIYIAEMVPNMVWHPITTDGVPGLIYNGIPHQGRKSMLTVSPDGNQIVYVSLNCSEVPVMSFPFFGQPGDINQQYPQLKMFRYSKPGNTIPKYTVWHLDKVTNERRVLAATTKDREIPGSMSWVSDKVLQIIFLNRPQNVSVTTLCSISADAHPCRKVYEDKNRMGWANDRLLRFSKDGERYIARSRQPFQRKEFYHLEIIHGNGRRFSLTAGNITVDNIIGWDEGRRLVYYQSYKPNQPSTSHTFAVHENEPERPYCMTCRMTSPEGVPCKFGHLSFSDNFDFFIGTCEGPAPEVVYLYKNVIPVEEPLKVIYDSAGTRTWLEEKVGPKVINLRVPVTGTMQAEVRLKLPPIMDYSGNTKYPLIIHAQGGPDTHQIQDNFGIDWSLYLTTNRSIIYGIIDGRGTGRKSTDMSYSVYKSLGTVEIRDQITVTKYLHAKLRFLDKKRTGIWGWGYGGYVTTKVLENDVEGAFKCGVAVSPITDWLYYDAVFTERYMGQPWDNPSGYTESSTLHNVENLRKKKYLLIHGTGDTRVHHQHFMLLAKVLRSNSIAFEEESYPDEDHNISSSRLQVFYTMDRFFGKCFNLLNTP